MALKPLNSVAGFSVGETPANVISANGDITANNFSTTGVANLNVIGNVRISGGTSGQLIQTDGNGNLSFTTYTSTSIANGSSNVQVLANANITFSSAGNANVVVITGTGANVDGYVSANYFVGSGNGLSNIQAANITGEVANANYATFAGTAYSVSGANVSGEVANANYATFAGTAYSVSGANVSGEVANANYATYSGAADTANTVISNAQPNITSVGTLTSLAVSGNVTANNFSTTGTGGDVTLTGGNVTGANVIIANSFTSNGGVVDFATNNANVQLGNVGNVHITGGSSGYVLTTDGSGNLNWSATASSTEIFNGNSNVSIPIANGNVYINANASVDEQWVFGTDGNTLFPSLGTANLGNLVIANYANFANDVVVQGNIANVNNISVTNSIAAGSANITNDLVVQGNIANANNISVTNNITSDTANVTGNLTSGNANLGNLVTVNYANLTNDLVVQGNIANANNISITNNLEGNTANFSGNITSLNANLGNLITANYANLTNDLDVGGNIVTGTGSGGNISGVNYITANVANITTVVNTGAIANGTSNIRLDTNGNVTISSNNTSNVFTFSDLGANVIGYIQANGIISAGGFVGSNLVSNVGILSLSAEQGATAYNINLLAGGAGNIDVGATYITSVKNPLNPQDAATKEYVDNISQGLFVHPPANVLTSSNLTASYLNGGTVLSVDSITGGKTITFSTNHGLIADDDVEFTNSFNGIIAGEGYFVYSAPTLNSITVKDGYFGVEVTTLTNGTTLAQPALGNGGVGATLTNSGANAALTIDNVLMTVGKRVLVTGQTNQFENGIYEVTTVGTVSVPWVLTRTTDGDSYQPKSATALCNGSYFFISQGTTYSGASYILTAPTGEIHIGVSNIVFTQFTSSGAYTPGSGINITGTVISANVDGTTTAIIGGNIAVANSAVFITPNIGAATGTSLDLTGNVIAGNLNSNATITTVDLNATGNIVANDITSNTNANITGNLNANNANITNNISVGSANITLNLQGNTANFSGNLTSLNANLGNLATANFANVQNNLYVGANANIVSTLTAANIVDTNLSNTQVVYANSSNTLVGTNNFVYDAANQVLKIGAGNTQIGGDSGYGYIQATTANIGSVVKIGSLTQIAYGNVTTTAITANQTIASLSATGVSGVEFLVKGIDSAGSKYSIATVQAVTDGANVDYTVFGTVQLGGYTGILAVNIVSGNVALQVTPASSNSTAWVTQVRTI